MKNLWIMVVACAACGGSSIAGGDDTDAGASTHPDAAAGARDASNGFDAGVAPGSPDAGSAAPDAGAKVTDAGSTGDTGATNPNQLACGPTKTCDLATQVCCVSFGGSAQYACTAKGACSGAEVTCDGPGNCSGQRCCASFPAGSSCKPSCGSGSQDICHVTSDCTNGQTCKTCATPGGGPVFNFCVSNDKCPF